MNGRIIYNASFIYGGVHRRITRPAYTPSQLIEQVASQFPGATNIKVVPA